MREDEQTPAPRRRRRAVGPPGARPTTGAGLIAVSPERVRPEQHDDDERLRRDVPPHHGS